MRSPAKRVAVYIPAIRGATNVVEWIWTHLITFVVLIFFLEMKLIVN